MGRGGGGRAVAEHLLLPRSHPSPATPLAHLAPARCSRCRHNRIGRFEALSINPSYPGCLQQETITQMPLLKTLVLAYTAAGVNAFATFPSQEGGAALPERMTYGGTVGGTSAKPLDSVGGTAYELAECQGDCDSDADCQALACPASGGRGAAQARAAPADVRRRDYCRCRRVAPPAPNIGSNPLAFGSGPLFECQGDCDNDDDCKTGLKCFQRDGYDAVPGCGEAGQGKKGWDYCVADGDAKLYSGGGTCPSGMTQFSGGCIDVTEQEPSECSVNGKDIFGPSKKACEERGLALCSMQEYLDAYMDGAATTGKQT